MYTSKGRTQKTGQGQLSSQRAQGKDIADHRPAAGSLRQLQTAINHSTGTQRLVQLKDVMNPQVPGLPAQLKSGVEALSGMGMDHVKVHYNSSHPARLNAHAYTQGSDIHVAPGQERHLPHEAWHVVQQAQGRVKPTLQMKGTTINDDAALEREADVMGGRALQSTGNSPATPLARPSLSAAAVQRAVQEATVNWGITHIVRVDEGSLFGGENPLSNELKPSEGGQLKKGDVLLIDDAPVLISRRGSNQEHGGKRTEDAKGNQVHEWLRVLRVQPAHGVARDFSSTKVYVRKETLTIKAKEEEKEQEVRNSISLHNIKDWEAEGIPGELHTIAGKWQTQGALRRTKSSGVLKVDENDMKKKKRGGLGKPSGRHWDQYDEGVNVATDVATEKHKPFDDNGQWRIKAVNESTGELVGVLIVENQDPLYLRWLIGNPEIKGGGSALLAAVRKLLADSAAESVEVTSAYSAKTSYTRSRFKVQGREEDVLPGQEFTLTLSKGDAAAQPIPPEHQAFVPEKYKYKGAD